MADLLVDGGTDEIVLGYFAKAYGRGKLVHVIGERLSEVAAKSRGALWKRQVSADQKRQQASSPHVKDWLKREEILSPSKGQPSNSKNTTASNRVVFLFAHAGAKQYPIGKTLLRAIDCHDGRHHVVTLGMG